MRHPDYRWWDIMIDSLRFVAVEKALALTELVVVLNRFEELRHLVKSSSPV